MGRDADAGKIGAAVSAIGSFVSMIAPATSRTRWLPEHFLVASSKGRVDEHTNEYHDNGWNRYRQGSLHERIRPSVTDFIVQHPDWASLIMFLTAATESIAVRHRLDRTGDHDLDRRRSRRRPRSSPAVADPRLGHSGRHRGRRPVVLARPPLSRPSRSDLAVFAPPAAALAGRGLLSPAWRQERRHRSVLAGDAAVAPVVAGVLGISPAQFYTANILSAIVWAPLHILPGAAIGAWLALLGGISGRLLAVLLGSVVLVSLALRLLRLVHRPCPAPARTRSGLGDLLGTVGMASRRVWS